MHHTTAYTSHIQNRNTWVIVEYHNELWENSKSNYTFVWATERKVQELLSKSVQNIGKLHKVKGSFGDAKLVDLDIFVIEVCAFEYGQ